MQIEPYLFFNGQCEEALAFYSDALGAEVAMLMRYKDSSEPLPADMVQPGSEDKVMHATLRIGDATIMASDGNCGGQSEFQGFSLSLGVASKAEAERFFEALAKDGKVDMPLEKTFWSPCFGMVTDRYGIGWMINVAE
jgi:PhnB protein